MDIARASPASVVEPAATPHRPPDTPDSAGRRRSHAPPARSSRAIDPTEPRSTQRLATGQAPRDLLPFGQRQPQRRPLPRRRRRPLQPVHIPTDRPPRTVDLPMQLPRRRPHRHQLSDPDLLTLRQPIHNAPPSRSNTIDGADALIPLRPHPFWSALAIPGGAAVSEGDGRLSEWMISICER